MPGRVTHSRVRGGVCFGASALYITGVGTPAPAGLRELVTWLRVCVLYGCTCALCVCARVCAWGGVSAPEPVGCAGGGGGGQRGAARPFCAARRPWKGQGKVTGGQRVGKSQEFLHTI